MEIPELESRIATLEVSVDILTEKCSAYERIFERLFKGMAISFGEDSFRIPELDETEEYEIRSRLS